LSLLSWEGLFETFYILNEGFLENHLEDPRNCMKTMFVMVPMSYECEKQLECRGGKKLR